VLQRFRSEGIQTPILVLTASGWLQRVEGIDAGADDYLTSLSMEEWWRGSARCCGGRGHQPVLSVGDPTSTPLARVPGTAATISRRGTGCSAISPTTRGGGGPEIAEHVYQHMNRQQRHRGLVAAPPQGRRRGHRNRRGYGA
jgi:CheY-like chemotaxis protein